MKFIKITEDDLSSGKYSPINVVFTLVCSKKGFLFVHRQQWNIWELPIGEVNKGETLRECAARRCEEESDQKVKTLKFIGLCEMQFEGRDNHEHFALFTAEIENEMPFFPNNDAIEIRWLKSLDEVSPLCMTCKNIIEYYESNTK